MAFGMRSPLLSFSKRSKIIYLLVSSQLPHSELLLICFLRKMKGCKSLKVFLAKR
jgi:hypothetical protein